MGNGSTLKDREALAEIWDVEVTRWRGCATRDAAVQAARAARDWPWYFDLNPGNGRRAALLAVLHEMEPVDRWRWLGEVWVSIEWPDRVLLGLMERRWSDREGLMTAEEHAAFSRLPDPFPIWRGDLRGRRRGFSWTLDQEAAEWFARRYEQVFHQPGRVVTGTAAKADVLAFFTRRGEAEVVIRPTRVRNVREAPIALARFTG
jgi:hypothetical protein